MSLGLIELYRGTPLDGPDLDFEWKGAGWHDGPEMPSPSNKLANKIGDITTCAEVSLLAGMLELSILRFSNLAQQVDHCLQFAEAAFAWQVDRRYYHTERGPRIGKKVESPVWRSVIGCIEFNLSKSLRSTKAGGKAWLPTVGAAYIMQHVTKGKSRKLYVNWLEKTLSRLEAVAHSPETFDESWLNIIDEDGGPDVDRVIPPGDDGYKPDPNFKSRVLKEWKLSSWGQPLPPQVLNPDFDYTPKKSEALIDEFLRQLDWSANPYLRSPEEMKKLGFEGQPYQLG